MTLVVENLTVQFGGVTAVENLSLSARTGRITGVIGPNGAGKTTTFNACSGLVACSAGTVHLGDIDITHRSPAVRARLGLGRTFQRMQLFRSMTVRENVAVAYEAKAAGANAWRQLVGTRGDRRLCVDAVDRAIELCGLAAVAEEVAGSLSTGRQRLVDLARACVTDPDVLLLDEPSSGLDRAETGEFGAILRVLMAAHPMAILLVEHDMSLVMSICDYLYVLDFGRLLFAGTPAETQASSVVRDAYLGSTSIAADVGSPA